MKKQILWLSLTVSFLFCVSHSKAQGVLSQDSLALVDFYNSTGGEDWYYNHWDLNTPVSTWSGVTISGNRVTGISLMGVFRNGRIEPSFGNLTELTNFSLLDCSLSFPLPAEFANLTKLKTLKLDAVFYEQPFPTIITQLAGLEELSMTPSIFTDSVPQSIGNLANLKSLNLSYSTIGTSIPATVGNLIKLEILHLNNSNLSGIIPPTFANLTKLRELHLNGNQLSGPFPIDISNLPDLESLFIEDNAFTFEAIEPLAASLSTHPVTYYNYSPQNTFSLIRSFDQLVALVGGTPSNTTYSWYGPGGNLVETKTGDSTFNPSVTGTYYVEVTNSIASGLVLTSEPYYYNYILLEFNTQVVRTISGPSKVNITQGPILLCSVQPSNGPQGLSGEVKITQTVESNIRLYKGLPYVTRHIDILPAANPSATGQVTLYFTQKDFDTYNTFIQSSGMALPLLPAGGVNNGNVRLYILHGTPTGGYRPENYPAEPVLITPSVQWDNLNKWWEVSFFADGFSGFFIHTNEAALPVSLINFTAYKSGNDIKLTWTTSMESAIEGYQVEKSIDGQVYSFVAQIPAKLQGMNTYVFRDQEVRAGKIYYRLKISHANGSNSYSNIISVTTRDLNAAISLYPNPVGNNLQIRYDQQAAHDMSLEIADATGKIVHKQKSRQPAGKTTIIQDVKNLPAGTYYLHLRIDAATTVKPFLKGK